MVRRPNLDLRPRIRVTVMPTCITHRRLCRAPARHTEMLIAGISEKPFYTKIFILIVDINPTPLGHINKIHRSKTSNI